MSNIICGEFVSCGMYGIKMVGGDYIQASSPFVGAHDLLDHTKQDRGTLEHELRALGAGILTRARMEASAPNSLLEEMEGFFAHACARVSELEAAPYRITGKSYLTR